MYYANEIASVHQQDKGLLKLENDILFKTIALDLEGVHISQALQTIADVADLKLMYSEDLLLNEKVVSLKKPSVSLYEALRSEEHTSELQSRGHLVCRLLLEKKKKES